MKRFLALLFCSFSALAANYAPPPVVPDYSSLTNRAGSLINPAAIVLGATNALDGNGGVFIYAVSTQAVNNLTVLPSTSTSRWLRTSYIFSTTPATSPLSLSNGTLSISALTNWFTFSAGTNMQVTVTSNTVSYAMTNTTFSGSGGSAISFNGTAVTNVNITNSHAFRWTGVDTNYQAYITNYFYWEGIPIQFPTVRDGVYIYWSQSGSNLTPIVAANSLDPTRWEQVPQGEFPIRVSAGVGDLEYGYIGSNLNLNPVTGELSATVPAGTNSWQIGVNGVLVTEPNLTNSTEILPSATGSNVIHTIATESIATNKINATFQSLLLNQYRINNLTNWFLSLTNNNSSDAGRVVWYTNSLGDYVAYATNLPAGGGSGAGTNAFVNGLLYQPFRLTNNFTDTGRVIWRTNSDGDILAYATNLPAGGGGGAGTNAFVNGVLQQPIRHTNSTDISWGDVGGSNWGLSINDSAFYGRLTNSLIASNNIAIAYDGSAHKVMISAITSGGSGTTVTVDGGSDLTRANLADASTTFLFDITTTNVTGRLPDRDFGDITVGSSGTGMTINANSVALGTDTTGNYVATVAGTANKVDVSGSGSETAAVTITLSDTIDLGGHTSFEIPNSSAPTTDAFGEIAGDANAWASGRGAVQFFDGTANTWLVGALSSDTPSNGQVPKWNTGGTITWEDDNAGGISDGDKVDITVSSSGTVWTIDNDVVTYAKMQNVSAASRVLGRGDSGIGDPQELTLGTGLAIVGTELQVTNSLPDGYFAGGYLPLFAGASNAITGDLFFKQSSDIRIPLWESGTAFNAVGLRSASGVFGISEFNTNDNSVLETFITVDPTGGSDDVITFLNSGFNNKVVFDADVEFNGTVTGSGIGDVISTANNNFTQTNNFSGPVNAATVTVNDNAYGAGWNGSTNVVTENAVYDKIESLSTGSNQWDEWDSWAIRRWEFGGNSSGLGLEPGLTFTAITSGTGGTTAGLSTFDGHNAYLIRTATGAATSTGGWVNEGVNTRYFTERANQLKFEFSAARTNGAVYGLGYSDSTTTSEATDALRLMMTNDIICGVALTNSIKAVTASTFQIQQSVRYRGFILQTNDYARFQIYSNVPGSSAVLVWEDTIASGIPLGSSRTLGISFGGFNTHTSVTNGTDFLYINRAIERTAQ